MRSVRQILSIILVITSLLSTSGVFAAGIPEEGSETDTALFNFEIDVQGFAGDKTALSTSDEQVFAGTKSLKMTVQTEEAATTYAKLQCQLKSKKYI